MKRNNKFIRIDDAIAEALTEIGNRFGKNVEEVAHGMLKRQIEHQKTIDENNAKFKRFRNALKPSLRHVEDTHPIFGGKIPKTVQVVLKTPLTAVREGDDNK